MASNDPEQGLTKMGPFDVIPCDSEFARMIPPARLAVCLLLVTFHCNVDHYAVLYHCIVDNERRTFLKGKWATLGLDDPDQEKECVELRGTSLIQSVMSKSGFGVVYVLANDGVLWAMGNNNTYSQLGRPDSDSGSDSDSNSDSDPSQDGEPTVFGRVCVAEPVLAIACGARHCLALTRSKVFSFGSNGNGQSGVAGVDVVKEPTEIYTGTGDNAPLQIAAAEDHSAILNNKGQVFTFGRNTDGEAGHGGENRVYTPTRLSSLKGKVEQIGCMCGATFFLADGKIFGCGCNTYSWLGFGHDRPVNIPTLINTGSHVITSFRCSYSLVVAPTQSLDVLVWGKVRGNVIKVPRVERLEFPRDFFSNGPWRDTGGSVHPVCVHTLQHRCRSALLQYISKHETDDLPLPTMLKEYLKDGVMKLDFVDLPGRPNRPITTATQLASSSGI